MYEEFTFGLLHGEFSHLPSLHTLDLDDPKMDDERFCVLVAALPRLSASLKSISFETNELMTKSLISLTSILSQLPILENLNMWGQSLR